MTSNSRNFYQAK